MVAARIHFNLVQFSVGAKVSIFEFNNNISQQTVIYR